MVKVKLLEQKQLNIDTNILHQVGLEFDVDSKNQIKNYKFGLFLKFGTPCILIDYLGIKYVYANIYKIHNIWYFFIKTRLF